jgi:nucleoside 2-deoxyribosyltransferase
MTSAYMSHSIRGAAGNDATDEQMRENCKRASEFAAQFRELFPMVDLYVPGENDEFVQKAYRMGILTEEQILRVDCELIRERDFLLMYTPDLSVSSGMAYEMKFADAVRKPVLFCPELSEDIVRYTRQFLANLGVSR